MGGYEHHYLSMTWAVPIHSKIDLNKAPKRGKWVVCLSRFACDPARKEHLLLKRWIVCTRIKKLRLKNGFLLMIEKCPSGMPRGVFFEYKNNNHFVNTEWSPINRSYFYPSLCDIIFKALLTYFTLSVFHNRYITINQFLDYQCNSPCICMSSCLSKYRGSTTETTTIRGFMMIFQCCS